MKHILFILTSNSKTGFENREAGYEFSEVADPYFEFINKGYTVDFASILAGKPPYVGYDATRKSSKNFMESNGFKRLNCSHHIENIDITAYDAIFFPGGLGLMTDMLYHPKIKEVIKNSYETHKIIGAVCHGPSALLNVTLSDGSNLLTGKKVNAFTKTEEEIDKHVLGNVIPFMLEDELKKQGAIFENTTPFKPFVVCDGNLVTGQNPASASGVARKMIELLN
ncbi:type 1 glutamine amidotransferase domain-containing protein [Flavobacterium sp. J27]|uniref:type 1 glutamine amidotransferase domain-containing protein n=1 Tax=Flavobacterium sp. J27 TaxID=2060419 RepID=UPI001030647E|nr:type 1 glutamine amidotransferase domain-containing protein [Flavobacterium sp. J27]